ncbi:hypothetical protein AVEN_201014-1 [Araneus ventricosus]|uniref:Uncharacterized protein n=1 Tax=Araneus ventricosus TaxID=182803 RepID=A0A4Y2K9D2_ARAVE|nr:hypothetical protein AVEN_201014-1 [Araneus ventricosus]
MTTGKLVRHSGVVQLVPTVAHWWRTVYVKCNVKKVAISAYGSGTSVSPSLLEVSYEWTHFGAHAHHSKRPQWPSGKVSVSGPECSRLETRFSRGSAVYGAHCTPRSGQMPSRWCGVEVWRWYKLRCRPCHLTTVQNDKVRPNSPVFLQNWTLM